jgi:2-methylcitrate dehydratase PrpD
MAQQIEKLAHFVAETTLDQVPAEVQSYAKLVVLDTIGVVLAGAQRPEVRELRARLSATAEQAPRYSRRAGPPTTHERPPC